MAVYTPKSLVVNKALGNGVGNIATFQYQASAVTGIMRSFVLNTPTAARTATAQTGTAATDTTAQRFFDALALTANVPYTFNTWRVVAASSYINAFANAADINGAVDGYEYA